MTEFCEIVLLKLGETVLKGNNRGIFEQQLLSNVRRRLKGMGRFDLRIMQSTIYIEPLEPAPGLAGRVAGEMATVYGVAAVNLAARCEKDMEKILPLALEYCAPALLAAKTFAVDAKRSDKAFPLRSPEICALAGAAVLERFPHLGVDLSEPDATVVIEIRDRAAYVHGGKIRGAGGLPVGVGGRGMLLLSGGIDSPVAGLMMAKRGMSLCCVHFESPPYTSPRAKQKVFDLAGQMSIRCGYLPVFSVDCAKIMEELRKNCPEELFTVLLRRSMMRVACTLAEREGAGAVITGESLGQVASQTLEALLCTEDAADRLVLRPLIGMDKEEIVKIARETGTYEISVRPFEDCCTVFTPRRPKTKPRLDFVLAAESKYPYAELEAAALSGAEPKIVKPAPRA